MKQVIKSRTNSTNRHLVILATCFLLLLTFCMVINPSKYINSCYKGMLIWATNVLPSLFPFFVITKILSELKCLDKFFNNFSKINKFLFNAPSCSGYIFCMSIISGYPVGAKLIEDFYSKKMIDEDDVNKLVTFCSTSGPLFIIGTVGSIMFNNANFGYILYIAHILSAILNGIIYRKKFVSKNLDEKSQQEHIVDYNQVLSKSMLDSILSIMIVGGYIAIFYMVIDILIDIQVLTIISALFEKIFNMFGLKNIGETFSLGLVEVTRGCKELSTLGLSPKILLPIASALIGFGGMSIHFQSLSFLTKCKVNTKFYFLQKITQTIFACAICYLICLFVY